jgi:universal stress protein G
MTHMFKRILVPVDLADTDLAKAAIETAVSLSRASGGSIRLLNVLAATPVMLAEYVPPDFDAQQRQVAEEALAIIAKESGTDSGHITTTVRQGGIYHEVLEEAKSYHADLVVMSSPRHADLFPGVERRPRGALCKLLGARGPAFGLGLRHKSPHPTPLARAWFLRLATP